MPWDKTLTYTTQTIPLPTIARTKVFTRYYPALDGLRGAAILDVTLCHFSAGYKGQNAILRTWLFVVVSRNNVVNRPNSRFNFPPWRGMTLTLKSARILIDATPRNRQLSMGHLIVLGRAAALGQMDSEYWPHCGAWLTA